MCSIGSAHSHLHAPLSNLTACLLRLPSYSPRVRFWVRARFCVRRALSLLWIVLTLLVCLMVRCMGPDCGRLWLSVCVNTLRPISPLPPPTITHANYLTFSPLVFCLQHTTLTAPPLCCSTRLSLFHFSINTTSIIKSLIYR